MPFHYEKSVSAGPFQFNFAKSGVSMSVGVTGPRIGMGPRGHYVHSGKGGTYYRASPDRAGRRSEARSQTNASSKKSYEIETSNVDMKEIESDDVMFMREEKYDELLDEINEKQSQIKLATTLGWFSGTISIFAFFQSPAAGVSMLLLTLVAWFVGNWIDSYKRTIVVFYDLEPDAQSAFKNVTFAFDTLMGCAGKWHIHSSGEITDLTTWKRNAGASQLVEKHPTMVTYTLPKVICSNVIPPSIQVGRQTIYFMPDVALIEDAGKFGAVRYHDLNITWQDSNFIEEGKVPPDAKIIGYNWKHPNKSGGPDRRFSNNYEIPVCRYEVMHISSANGINELVEFSRIHVAGPFSASIKKLPT